MGNLKNKIQSLYGNFPESENFSDLELRYILDALIDINFNKQFQIYEDLYNWIDLSLTPSVIIISLLRTPFVYRKNINNYFEFLDKAKIEMKNRNLLKTLHGLDSNLFL